MPDQSTLEEWRPVIGYEGWYEVSNTGYVRRYGQQRTLVGSVSKGHRGVLLSRAGVVVRRRVHRLVAEAFLLQPPLVVNHKNGNGLDCSVDNLEWVTQPENERHAVKNRLKAHGEGSSTAKLSALHVKAIRELYPSLTECQLAQRFGVRQGTISQVLRRKTWTHL